MSNSEKTTNPDLEKLPEILESLEKRIKHIEVQLGIENALKMESISANDLQGKTLYDAETRFNEEEDFSIESNIVEYGLGWFGSLVLLFGITFLMTFFQSKEHVLLSSIIGYSSVVGIFALGYFMRHSFTHLVYPLNISSYLLLYYVTLRLNFFSSNPLISQKGIVLVLLVLIIGAQIYFAIRRKAEFIASLAIILALITALFSDTTHITLPLITLTAATSLFLFIRYAWWRLLIFSILLVYFTHLLWFMSNPIMGHPFHAVATQQYNLFYLFSYSAIFSFVTLIRQKGLFPSNIYVSSVLLNGMSFSFILLLVILTFLNNNYISLFIAISVFCLIFSIILQTKTERPYTPSLYACYSFMALSVAVYGFAKLPDSYFYLALQSLLVVSMALWFRSKIIVVINTLLFLGILLAYHFFAPSINHINFTFAIVALLTARILNWQKKRLTLKTEMLRNIYLFVALIMVLFSLYQALPSQYITLSWTLAATFFFILSILLHNVKYRWMAIYTIIITGIYLFVVDLTHMEVGYRIVAFLFFAVISFSASLYYTKRIKKKSSQQGSEDDSIN